MESKKVNQLFVTQYSEYPGPRYCVQGPFSGEDYYHKVLNSEFYKAITNEEKLQINLDGTAGYASSFLDEALGNLVYDFGEIAVKNNIFIVSEQEPEWKEMILNDVFNQWEQRRKNIEAPKKTIDHPDHFTIKDVKITKTT